MHIIYGQDLQLLKMRMIREIVFAGEVNFVCYRDGKFINKIVIKEIKNIYNAINLEKNNKLSVFANFKPKKQDHQTSSFSSKQKNSQFFQTMQLRLDFIFTTPLYINLIHLLHKQLQQKMKKSYPEYLEPEANEEGACQFSPRVAFSVPFEGNFDDRYSVDQDREKAQKQKYPYEPYFRNPYAEGDVPKLVVNYLNPKDYRINWDQQEVPGTRVKQPESQQYPELAQQPVPSKKQKPEIKEDEKLFPKLIPRTLTQNEKIAIEEELRNESTQRFQLEEAVQRKGKSAKIHNEYNLQDSQNVMMENTMDGLQPSMEPKMQNNIGMPQEVQRTSGAATNSNCCSKLEKKHKLMIFVAIVIVALVGVGVGLGLALGKKAQSDPSAPVPQIQPFCQTHPSECQGVPTAVTNFILANYTQPDQVHSLLQVSRTLTTIPLNTTNITRDALVQAYRNVVKSVECMAYIMPDGYNVAYQTMTGLQFGSEAALEQYLNMSQSFSGQPLRLTSAANIENNCRFNISAGRRRRLQQSQPPSLGTTNCTRNNSVLIYFNGLGYTPNAAIENLRQIQSILGTNSSTNFDAGVIAVGAWRRDGYLGFLIGLVLAYEQMVQQQGGDYVPGREEILTFLKIVLEVSVLGRGIRLTTEAMREAFKKFEEYFIEKSVETIIQEQSRFNIQRHKEFVVQQLNQGKKVVLLAHSQGTLYANKVYTLLTPTQQQSVSLLYIAPAANSMADNSGNYITNPRDYYILALRAYALVTGGFPSPMADNVPGVIFQGDGDFGVNHDVVGYVHAYRDKVVEMIVAAKARASQPGSTWGSGPITVTLTWDAQPDIDLHIFQPNGRHVYYSSKIGNNGYLDVDDVTSYGPEHYYTNCTLQQGNYTFRLNYYRGSGTSQTLTTVSAGSEFAMKSLALYPPMGSSGNASPPYFICKVNVAWNGETGAYQFTIISQL